MRRIIVIGCPGAGKTTLSERLHKRLGLPLFYLDAIWHKPDRTHIERAEFDRRLGELLCRDEWIIDGNYSRTLERRLAACDTVILLDLPAEECLAGARARLGRARPDMPWIDTELDPALQREIEGFRQNQLPTVYALLEQYRQGREIFVCKSRTDADTLLSRLGEAE